jgi:hypothetical protein
MRGGIYGSLGDGTTAATTPNADQTTAAAVAAQKKMSLAMMIGLAGIFTWAVLGTKRSRR